ncbi:MAG: hypothetical protein KDJ52_02985 [Anaerolineae bacterium]|nr:hypothetical protein [Anaerolineae bacterium]
MLSNTHQSISIFIASILFAFLACTPWQQQTQAPPPTATPIVLRFNIDGQAAAVNDPNPTPTRTQNLQLPTVQLLPTPAPTLTSTPVPSSTVPLAQPTTLLLPTLPPPTEPLPTPTSTPEAEGGIYTGNMTDLIEPQGPGPGYTLPSEANQLEFKWAWRGVEIRPCQLQEGYSFEVRLWPAPDNPHLVGSSGPMGTIDVAEAKDIIAASCDPKSGTWRYTVNYLHQTPAVVMAGGEGHFFWDVAYIQIDPYQPQMVSLPQDFFIPPSANSPTRTPVPTATAFYYPEPAVKPSGNITLLAPESGKVFGADVGPVEFKWHWDGPILTDTCQPAERYGFELRVGSVQPGYSPLGVIDVTQEQYKIGCDREAGVFHLTVLDIKQLPGIKQPFIDERWDGHYRWDVALVSIQPYISPDSAPPPNTFEISLSHYAGPLDPLGETLACGVFSSWIEAQAIFLASGGPGTDFHGIDPDGNGLACDELRK